MAWHFTLTEWELLMRYIAPSRPMRFLLSLCALPLLALAACSDTPTAPAEATGRYALEQVDGAPLPAAIFDGVVADTSGDFHLKVVATTGWLELTAGGRYDHGVDLAVTIDGQPQPMVRWRDHGVYVQHADTVPLGPRKSVQRSNTLSFDSEYLQNVSFDGAIEQGRLHIVQDLAGEGRVARFSFRR